MQLVRRAANDLFGSLFDASGPKSTRGYNASQDALYASTKHVAELENRLSPTRPFHEGPFMTRLIVGDGAVLDRQHKDGAGLFPNFANDAVIPNAITP
jgi:hypothetical protein